MKIKFKIAIVSFALISALFLSGCNTTRGLGEDIEHGGESIQRAAS
jgi:entericidin B